MSTRALLAFVLLLASPAVASGDETWPVPAHALVGHAYFGGNTPSQMRFINVRIRPVVVNWVAFDGSERTYAKLGEGEEIIQPTFVAHRWVIRDGGDGTLIQGFISTRSARSDGTPQIALIR